MSDITMKRDQENVSKLLRDTVMMLCKNSLSFGVGLRVQGLLGITIDDSDVFIVQFDDMLHSDDDEQIADSSSCFPLPSSQGPFVNSDHAVGSNNLRQITSVSYADHGRIKTEPDNTGLHHSSSQAFDKAHTQNMDVVLDSDHSLCHGAAKSCSETCECDGNEQRHFLSTEASNEAHHGYKVLHMAKQDRPPLRPAVKEQYRNHSAKQVISKYRRKQYHPPAIPAEQALVVTWSLHQCGYNDCGKQFRYKHDLLRHQTRKHGRQPTRKLGLRRVWMRPDDEGC